MAAELAHLHAPMHAEITNVLVLLWPPPLLRLVTQWFPSSFCSWQYPAAERHNRPDFCQESLMRQCGPVPLRHTEASQVP